MHSRVYDIFNLNESKIDEGFRNYVRSLITEEISDDDRIEPYGEKGINMHSFEPKDTLCPDLFDGQELKLEVLKRIKSVYKKALNDIDIPMRAITDVILVGSIVSYHWSSYSDVDIHIVVDPSEISQDTELALKWLDKERLLWNIQNSSEIEGYEAEIYFQSVDAENISNGVYSVLFNRWIKIPDKETFVLDKQSIEDKALAYIYEIDNIVEDTENQTPAKVGDLLKKIYKSRKEGLAEGGEFSEKNIVYKVLRRTGHLQKLLDLSNSLLSTEENESAVNEGLIMSYPIYKVASIVSKKYGLLTEEENRYLTNGRIKEIFDLGYKGIFNIHDITTSYAKLQFVEIILPKKHISLIEGIKEDMAKCGYIFVMGEDNTQYYDYAEYRFERKFDIDATEFVHEKKYLYHMCSFESYPRIMKQGLTPRESQFEGVKNPSRVYAFFERPSNSDFKYWANDFKTHKEQKITGFYMFRIDISKLPKDQKFYFDPRMEHVVYTTQGISPSVLQVERKLNLQKNND